jgi:hypothetical protein
VTKVQCVASKWWWTVPILVIHSRLVTTSTISQGCSSSIQSRSSESPRLDGSVGAESGVYVRGGHILG